MRTFFTSFITMGLLSILFGCTSKKKGISHISDWLAANYPGQYEVLSTPTNFTDKDYYLSKRESVIALTSDKEVQFIIPWIKQQDSIGVTKEMIDEALQRSQKNVTLSRSLVKQIQDAGIMNVSVGVSSGYGHILVFKEPTPGARDSVVQSLVTILQSTSEDVRIPFEVSFMEPNVYGIEFQQVVPAGHWARRDSWHHNKEIMRLSISIDPIPDAKSLSDQWHFNTLSERLMTYLASAHKEAVAWASKHIKKPVTIEPEQMVEFGLEEENGLRIIIDFPVYEGDTIEASGSFVTGVYDIDAGTFSKIKVKTMEE